jgi:hypothetical protein
VVCHPIGSCLAVTYVLTIEVLLQRVLLPSFQLMHHRFDFTGEVFISSADFSPDTLTLQSINFAFEMMKQESDTCAGRNLFSLFALVHGPLSADGPL